MKSAAIQEVTTEDGSGNGQRRIFVREKLDVHVGSRRSTAMSSGEEKVEDEGSQLVG